MIDRKDFLESIVRECTICKYLFTRIPSGSEDFRLSPPQRSTIELLRYLSMIGIASLRAMDSDWSSYQEYHARAEKMEWGDFPAAMDRQIEEICSFFATLSDDDLEHRMVAEPDGTDAPLGVVLMRTTYAWMIGYRMQLFLHAKAAGNAKLGTADNWYGIEWPAEEEVDEQGEVVEG
jgi:hypothetical protein